MFNKQRFLISFITCINFYATSNIYIPSYDQHDMLVGYCAIMMRGKTIKYVMNVN